MRKKILYFVSHPIQYQVPLINSLTKNNNIDLLVVYFSIFSFKKYFDIEFNKKIKYDTNLKFGYNYNYIFKDHKSQNFISFLKKFINIFLNFKPEIFWIHGYDDKYKLFSIFLAKVFKCKILLRGESNFLGRKNYKFYYFSRKIFFFFLDYFVDAYLAIGKKNKSFYREFVDKKKIFFVPYVVDNDFFKKKNKIKKNKNLTFLFVGKLIEKKNIELLLRSFFNVFKNNDKVCLIIVGDGPKLYDLKKLYNFKNIYFAGFVNQSKIFKFYSRSHIFILPSNYEPWGLATNEAMLFSNVLLLSSNVGCAYDFIKKNINGLIFKNNSQKDLEKCLYRLYSLRKKIILMGKTSSQIINKWSVNFATNNFIKIINKI